LLHPASEHIHQGQLGVGIRPGLRLFLGTEVLPGLSRSALRRLASRYRHQGASLHLETYSLGSTWYLHGLRRVNRWIMDTIPATVTPTPPTVALPNGPTATPTTSLPNSPAIAHTSSTL
jgi:hypothetical protein